MKKISFLLSFILLCTPIAVFAAEINVEESTFTSEGIIISEEIETEVENVEKIENNEATEMNENNFVNDEEIVRSEELTSKIIINPIIVENTTPMIESVVIDVYNINTGKIDYIKLQKNDGYSGEIDVPSGDYSVLLSTDSAADTITLSTERAQLSNNSMVIDMTIEGLTDEELAAWNDTSLKGESEGLLEMENGNNEVVEEPEEEKSFMSGLFGILLNNIFFIIVFIVLFIAYFKIKNNKYN